jgi:DNA-binding transcriptional ArsR family regulator
MSHLIPESLIEHVAERFRVLGDATRLSILRLLLERGELNVGEICDALEGSSQANVSKHLRILHVAGIVSRRREGTAAYYRIADPSIAELCDMVCDRLTVQAVEEARTFAIA